MNIIGQGWLQASELGTALLLSAIIGLEREVRGKDAGLGTHTLVGVGAALFMLVSKYGFYDVVNGHVVILDPSRVAAQIVSGIGFLGAGIIFVNRGTVRGLTSAAAIWVTAAVGSAAGAGLLILAALTTGAYLIVTLVLPAVRRRLPLDRTSTLRIRYADGRGLLRTVINEATRRGYVIDALSAEPAAGPADGDGSCGAGPAFVAVTMRVHGKRPVSDLAAVLTELDLVDAVAAADAPDEAG